MSGINLFAPKAQGTVIATSATSTASVALTKPASANQIRVKNIDSTNIVYINFGNSTVVATIPTAGVPGSMPVGPGETVGVTVPEGTTHVATISLGTPVVYFTPGNGV